MRRILLPLLLVSLAGCGKAPAVRVNPARVTHWVQALQSPDAKVRKKAAFTLGNLAGTDPAIVPALKEALKDADPAVRSEAILSLVRCGDRARDAIPALTEVRQQDPDDRARAYAAKALEKLQNRKG